MSSIIFPFDFNLHLPPHSIQFFDGCFWFFCWNLFFLNCFPDTMSRYFWSLRISNISFLTWILIVLSNLLDMRNLQDQVKKAFCHQKLFWPFTVWINCSSDLKNFANPRPSASNFKSFSQSLEQFFLTVGQNIFGNKIQFLLETLCDLAFAFTSVNFPNVATKSRLKLTTIPKVWLWLKYKWVSFPCTSIFEA